MDIARQFAFESWQVILELSPWMLVGMAVAGLLHGLLPKDFIRRQLQGPSGVLKAVALGVPLPLCSCGVIPAGLGLKQDGASNGSSVAFLIATPQTGVDSVLVSGGLLGWPFALFKVVTAAITGIVGGWISDAVSEPAEVHPTLEEPQNGDPSRRSIWDMVAHSVEVLRSIWRWLAFGVLVSATISVSLPVGSLEGLQAGGGLYAALAMLVLSVPLYVCATASVPIAAALVSGGMPTGAALVFLMAGPATNVATIGAIYRGFGGRILGVYLGTIIVGSVGFGLTFDWILQVDAVAGQGADHVHGASWWALLSSVVLLSMVAWFAIQELQALARGFFVKAPEDTPMMDLVVSGLTCGGCVNKLDGALRKLNGVEYVSVQLEPQRAVVGGTADVEQVKAAIRAVGFETP